MYCGDTWLQDSSLEDPSCHHSWAISFCRELLPARYLTPYYVLSSSVNSREVLSAVSHHDYLNAHQQAVLCWQHLWGCHPGCLVKAHPRRWGHHPEDYTNSSGSHSLLSWNWELAFEELHNPRRRVYIICKVKLAEGGNNDSRLDFRWPVCNYFLKACIHLTSIVWQTQRISPYRKGVTFCCHSQHDREDSHGRITSEVSRGNYRLGITIRHLLSPQCRILKSL